MAKVTFVPSYVSCNDVWGTESSIQLSASLRGWKRSGLTGDQIRSGDLADKQLQGRVFVSFLAPVVSLAPLRKTATGSF